MVVCIETSEYKIYSDRDIWSIYDDFLDLVVVVDCWPFTREISDNRRRKCLQILGA